jgi:predicted RNA-binding Zn-ribbon protein involved in translation (DUF1610 family)
MPKGYISAEGWVDPDGTLHEVYSGAILVGGEFLGPISYDSGRADLRWQRSSLAYFCPKCGEVWARLAVADSRGVQQDFLCVHVSCEHHDSRWHVPGSLLVDHAEQLFEDFPPDAVAREFRLHLTTALKGQL